MKHGPSPLGTPSLQGAVKAELDKEKTIFLMRADAKGNTKEKQSIQAQGHPVPCRRKLRERQRSNRTGEGAQDESNVPLQFRVGQSLFKQADAGAFEKDTGNRSWFNHVSARGWPKPDSASCNASP